LILQLALLSWGPISKETRSTVEDTVIVTIL